MGWSPVHVPAVADMVSPAWPPPDICGTAVLLGPTGAGVVGGGVVGGGVVGGGVVGGGVAGGGVVGGGVAGAAFGFGVGFGLGVGFAVLTFTQRCTFTITVLPWRRTSRPFFRSGK